MRVTKSRIQQIIKEELDRKLFEAPEDEKKSKKTKTKEKERSKSPLDKDDLANRSLAKASKKTAKKDDDEDAAPARGIPGYKAQRGNGPKLDQFRGADVAGSLDQMADHAQEGDFDQEFADGLERGLEADAELAGDVDYDPEPGRRRPLPPGFKDPAGDPVNRFQPNVPAVIDEPGLVHRPERDPKEVILEILMDEFVKPALGLGQHLLPAVWAELARLMQSNRMVFLDQFGGALNTIRDIENDWFSDLLGIYPDQPIKMAPAEGAEREMRSKIVRVLNKYYGAVLSAAENNRDNMVEPLMALRDQIGEEAFSQAFFEALSETRDIEDEAFGQLMGGARKLPGPRG